MNDPVPEDPVDPPVSIRRCSIPDCQRPYKAKGLCGVHYTMKWKRKRAKAKRQPMDRHRPVAICWVSSCEDTTHAFGLCLKHSRQEMSHRRAVVPRPAGTPIEACEVPGCDVLQFDHGLCRRHFSRVKTADGLDDWDDMRSTLFSEHR
ncbi:hypothetical protein [Mycolicibacterium conceptionense]|nr:hypothetical protein [Mycolicibacterium conceptionense]